MRLIDLHIDGFGKFHDYNLSFEPGVNILYGRNEAGKSTLHTFLRAMLFGIDKRPGKSGKKALYESLEPWEEPERYAGTLRFSHENRICRIERRFFLAPDDLRIVEETPEGERELENPQLFLKEALMGLSETGYINTISIGQLKTSTEKGMAEELRRYIKNLSTTGSSALNADAAIAHLRREQEQLKSLYQKDAVRDYTGTVGKIKNLEAKLALPENENLLLEYRAKQEEVNAEAKRAEEDRAELWSRIQKAEETLKENRFTDDASIRQYGEETDKSYADYKQLKGKAEKRLRRLLPVCLMALAVLSAAGAVLYSYRTEFILFCGAALLLIVLSALLLISNKKLWKKLLQEEAVLKERIRFHTGDETVSDASVQGLKERLSGFLELYAAIQRYKERLSVADELRLELSRRQTACMADIERQREIGFFVEQSLTELHRLKQQAAELRAAIAENERIKEKADAMGIAIETLTELSEHIGESLGMYLNKEAAKLIAGVTDGAYKSIDVGSGKDIYLNQAERMIPIESVSSGTIDQIYLALRLAAVRLIEGGKDVLPLIFDDSFVLYDDRRLKSAVSFIAKEYQAQILIFSCHHREEAALKEAGISYHLERI